jgi:hypothetical protein
LKYLQQKKKNSKIKIEYIILITIQNKKNSKIKIEYIILITIQNKKNKFNNQRTNLHNQKVDLDYDVKQIPNKHKQNPK